MIVLDMGMPGMDGWDACRRLRAAQATSKTSIIAVTGHALTGAEVAAKAAGCDVYLTKPLRPSRLFGDELAVGSVADREVLKIGSDHR